MNKGYAKRVIEATAQAAVAANCTCLVTDATNVVSQHLLHLFGYSPIKKVGENQLVPAAGEGRTGGRKCSGSRAGRVCGVSDGAAAS
jgi:hypothetical protein